MDTIEVLIVGTVARVTPRVFPADPNTGEIRSQTDVHVFSGVTPVKIKYVEADSAAVPAEGQTVALLVAVRAYNFNNRVGLSVRYLRDATEQIAAARKSLVAA